MLYYRDADLQPKWCLMREEAKQAVQELHDGALGGHFGRDLTIKRVRKEYWWLIIWKDVADYICTCDVCQQFGPKERHNLLQPYEQTYPFEIIFVDFIISLPTM